MQFRRSRARCAGHWAKVIHPFHAITSACDHYAKWVRFVTFCMSNKVPVRWGDATTQSVVFQISRLSHKKNVNFYYQTYYKQPQHTECLGYNGTWCCKPIPVSSLCEQGPDAYKSMHVLDQNHSWTKSKICICTLCIKLLNLGVSMVLFLVGQKL